MGGSRFEEWQRLSVFLPLREMVYFMMRRKLLHRMKEGCGATSHKTKGELIVGAYQVDGSWVLFIFIYIYIWT